MYQYKGYHGSLRVLRVFRVYKSQLLTTYGHVQLYTSRDKLTGDPWLLAPAETQKRKWLFRNNRAKRAIAMRRKMSDN